jgi:hypothetical protein
MIARPNFGITNLVSVAAALLLAASPWLVGFTGETVAAGNAVLCGLLMVSFTVAALVRLREWRSW